MLPSWACSRKQIRQIPKSRITPCGRPQSTQRRTTRDLNFGGRFAFAIIDFLAIVDLLFRCSGIAEELRPNLPNNPARTEPSARNQRFQTNGATIRETTEIAIEKEAPRRPLLGQEQAYGRAAMSSAARTKKSYVSRVYSSSCAQAATPGASQLRAFSMTTEGPKASITETPSMV